MIEGEAEEGEEADMLMGMGVVEVNRPLLRARTPGCERCWSGSQTRK